MVLAILLFSLATIVIGGFLYYVANEIFTTFLTTIRAAFPTSLTGDWVTFVEQWWLWMPLSLIMIALVLWAFTQSQREGYGELV